MRKNAPQNGGFRFVLSHRLWEPEELRDSLENVGWLGYAGRKATKGTAQYVLPEAKKQESKGLETILLETSQMARQS